MFLRHLVLVPALAAIAVYAAPITGFTQTDLTTSATDPDLINPWGISFSATSPFWISDNGTGKATLYNSVGVKQGLVVTMPAGSEPITGQVFNGSGSFHGDLFLFASENGTIAGWRNALGTTAEQLFSVPNAAYKGLAISSTKDTLYAANFASGFIDVFDSAHTAPVASYTDPTLPLGYAPFNIQNLGGTFYVTWAKKASIGIDDMPGPGNGFVDRFDPVTHAFTRVVSNGVLNSPWGLAIAPSGFGGAGGSLLVGNFGDGLINAFQPNGMFVGTLASPSGVSLANDGLWGLTFGNGGNGGNPGSLYLTAGTDGEAGGTFARIDANVPEPDTAALSAFAFLLLVLAGRAKRRGASAER